ncbi:MAG: FKBP-type peptidyl-prolyl cis-trans isomerase [Methylococcales bacterium]|nr:FKBP-type peptidyl-prolyl cis-trans isomerase [Methylococcales bacterium]
MKSTQLLVFSLSILFFIIIGYIVLNKLNASTPDENKTAGIAFLAENAKKEGIITTESGLQYEILTEGTGGSPAASNQVTVHYLGTTLDGNEFDSSYGRGSPATFPLNRVIAGWTEGLQLMKEGAKYRFFIPSDLAYGERGAGANIPANAALIFEVELIKVN